MNVKNVNAFFVNTLSNHFEKYGISRIRIRFPSNSPKLYFDFWQIFCQKIAYPLRIRHINMSDKYVTGKYVKNYVFRERDFYVG